MAARCRLDEVFMSVLGIKPFFLGKEESAMILV
jgi:hypothetical protein